MLLKKTNRKMREEISELLEQKKGKINPGIKLIKSFRNFLSSKWIIFFIFLLIFIIGVTLFTKFEFIDDEQRHAQFIEEGKNPYFESVYWLITTMTTVGYGDYSPGSFKGKIVTMAIMIFGIGLLGFLLSQLTQKIVQTNLGSLFGVTHTKKKIDYIIIGWNKISDAALTELSGPDKEVVVVDRQQRPEIASRRDLTYVTGNPASTRTLLKANIEKAAYALITLEEDSDVILVIHVIRKLNPWINIVAKINNFEHIVLAKDAGADEVVSPFSIGGRLIATAPTDPMVVKWMIGATTPKSNLTLTEYDISKNSKIVGMSIKEINRQLEKMGKIIGIDTPEGFEKVPSNDFKLRYGDKLILLIDKTKFNILKRGKI